ncbi:sulfatase [Mangrovibacterium sp.]|uniref:sulfatase family protein n=1 Tax=Mangrovibacterium sp. TaxID=1961364 RepID=UPI0035682999
MYKSSRTAACLMLGLTSSISGFSEQKVEPKQRPNIIFLLTDDQRWDGMGAMGNPIIQTPNMDALATQGILFQNAYVTTSICCVSRASVLTGLYESGHGVHDFNTDLKPDVYQKSYPHLLKEAGYKIGFIGKYGVGHHPPFHEFDFVFDTEEGGKAQPDYITIGKNGKEIHDTDTIGESILSFVDKFADQGPFCLSVSFKAPHEQDGNPPKYVIQPEYQHYYQDVTIPTPVTADPIYWEKLPDVLRTEANFGRERWKGLFGTPELYQENVKNYYRLITGVDDVVGKLRDKLESLGVADNTIIILMGDNGMFLGEHGMEGKWYGYEESVRVPLFIYAPGLPDKIKQYRAPQMALNIDIAPTILSLAGVEVPEGMHGMNLIDVVENKTPERTDFFYQHYFLGGPQIPMVEGVVGKDFKYMNYIEVDSEELFDTKHDQHEIENLAADPAYKNKLEELKKRYQELKAKYSVSAEERAKINKAF